MWELHRRISLSQNQHKLIKLSIVLLKLAPLKSSLDKFSNSIWRRRDSLSHSPSNALFCDKKKYIRNILFYFDFIFCAFRIGFFNCSCFYNLQKHVIYLSLRLSSLYYSNIQFSIDKIALNAVFSYFRKWGEITDKCLEGTLRKRCELPFFESHK